MKSSVASKLYLIKYKNLLQSAWTLQRLAWDTLCDGSVTAVMGEKNPRQLDESIKMFSLVARFLWKTVFWNIYLIYKTFVLWVAGPFRCGFTQMEHTWKLVSVELAGEEQANLFKNHLDFQMYLDRPNICSKNQIPPVNHLFYFLVVSSCPYVYSLPQSHQDTHRLCPTSPGSFRWESWGCWTSHQAASVTTANSSPKCELEPDQQARSLSYCLEPERISGRDRENNNTWECVQIWGYFSFYTLQCLLIKINKIVKS